MIDLSPYKKYLIPTENGLGVSKDCPDAILKELQEINSEYETIYGEKLLDI